MKTRILFSPVAEGQMRSRFTEANVSYHKLHIPRPSDRADHRAACDQQRPTLW